MTLDERGAWELTLDNGISLRLGRQDVDTRFDRFITAAARIVVARAADIPTWTCVTQPASPSAGARVQAG